MLIASRRVYRLDEGEKMRESRPGKVSMQSRVLRIRLEERGVSQDQKACMLDVEDCTVLKY